jgi:DNA topoisomerase-1
MRKLIIPVFIVKSKTDAKMKLVVCEKNISARRIAYILSDGRLKSKKIGKIPVYEFTKNGENWEIVGLKGHIINLDFPRGFNIWNQIQPRELINVKPVKKISEKSIGAAIKILSDRNPFVIVATDFDREGELIGVEVIELIKEYNKHIKEIKRAKFSAITGYEINNAFKNLSEVNYNLSNAGETRQIIDLIWGAVLTRFISLTSNRLGKDFLSIGRVQSPTLALLVDREKEILNFEPKTFWKIIATCKKNRFFDCVHCEGQFWDETKVNTIFNKIKNSKTGKVEEVNKKIQRELPPSPFSTTSFLESASYIGISAARAMKVAEELYMSGLISYPRTDNTVYPSSLNIKNILEKLKNSDFSKEVEEVIKNGREYPTRGKKQTTDHPPIHPVGVPGHKKLLGESKKIYDLIVRRFLATLAKDAISETIKVVIDISDEKFNADGYILIEPNWRDIYIYYKEKRKPLPDLIEGENIDIAKIVLKEDKTKPPTRYTQGSLIGKMEKLNLGTKSTRHEIIQKLFSRKYITFTPLKPTPMGFAVVEAMGDCDVVKPKMTSRLEFDMDAISEGKKTLEETIDESRKMLTKVMVSLEKDKEKIRTKINNASRQQNVIAKCPKCGKDLVIRFSKKGNRFVGCTGYPDCMNTYPIPQKGGIATVDKLCSKCKSPQVKIINKGKRPWQICLNPNCLKK